MAVQPAQLDPLPLPQLDQNPAGNQNPPVPPAAQPQAGMGFVKPAGAGAYVASQILTGWMAGRNYKREQELKTAKDDVTGAKGTYDVLAQSYQNMIDSGVDQNSEQFKQTKAALTNSWNNYLNIAQKYSEPEEKAGKKKGFKDRAHDAFMGQDPHLFVQSSLDVLRKSGPPALTYDRTEEQKNNVQLQKQQLEQNKNILAQQGREAAKQAEVDEAQKQYTNAVKNNDEKGKHEAREILAGLGVNVQRVESEAEAQVADEIAKTKLEGMQTLDTKGKTVNDLTVAQRAALGISLGPLDYYEGEVGPGKKFKSNIDAYKGYLRDTAASQAIAGNSAQAWQWNQMKKAEASVLEHDLQDPKTAREYGLPGPLKPGEKVPDWLVEKSVMGRLRPSPEERIAAKTNVDKSISSAINNTLQYGLDAKSSAWAKQYLFDYDSQTKQYSLKPNLPEKQSHWFKGDTVGGMSQEDFEAKRNSIMGQLSGYIRKTNPEASQQRIMDALNSGDPGSYFLDNPAAASPTPGQPQPMTPPPTRPQTMEQLGNEPQKMKFQVEADGKVQEMELTQEEADYIQKTHPDVKVRYSGFQPQPHGR